MSSRHFHFLTLFPEVIHSWMNSSILKKAVESEIFSYSVYQLRDYATNKHKSVDDVAYGGGGGMVLKVDVLVAALQDIRARIAQAPNRVIYFSPVGKTLSRPLLDHYRANHPETHLILVCGHYEGVDQRFIDRWVDDLISLGDFVLTGGELPALAFADSLSRHLVGTLKREGAQEEESFSLSQNGKSLLEYPHYTRPPVYEGMSVPEVLLTGDHGKILEWRKEQALSITQQYRPDLLK